MFLVVFGKEVKLIIRKEKQKKEKRKKKET